MDKEQFSKLLIEQQDKGKALLSIIANMHESQNDFGDGMAMFGGEDLYYVPDNELNEFINKFTAWKSYVYELLETQFGNDCKFVYEWNTYVITYVSKRLPILKQLSNNVNKALSLIDSFLERVDLKEEKKMTNRKFNEDDVSLFESLINQGENILVRYHSEAEDNLVNSNEFNSEYDQWRSDVFRLFDTHFDLKNDVVFNEIGMNSIFIFKKRGASYVEIILRALKACYRIPYKTKSNKQQNNIMAPQKTDSPQSINISISNENKQNQNQTQELHLLVDLLKDSLAPYQIKELKEIAQADCPEPEKRQKLLDKIMNFGSNFGASVLANILTNPAVYGLL